ncbi:MAG: hypothetical protein HY305_05135 [Sphingobacteriales bacterium]|nr:hypothetical protein [Sphingobacteriales bacterium]
MCAFQSLYFDDDGYVVRCPQCSMFQVAFSSSMLTLSEEDFEALRKVVAYKCNQQEDAFSKNTKSVLLPTPSYGMYILLTKAEANRFNEILEEADNEMKALLLLSLFDQ